MTRRPHYVDESTLPVKNGSPGVTRNITIANDSWRSRAAGAALIIILAELAYLPALPGKFVWDDDSWTTGIPALLRDSAGLRAMWLHPTALQQYYPLTGTTFWIDYHLWGFHTFPYHVENVLLHLTSAFLFWALLRRLRVPGAWLAAAIFALHPLMVESVAWITERKNTLSLVLYLAALLTYGSGVQFWQDDANPPPLRKPNRTTWFAAFVLFTAALLAKATAFSFPAVVLLICWWKRGRIRWRADVVPTLPFFALAIGFCMGTSWLEKNRVGAGGPDFDLSFPQRCLIAGRVVWFYAGKLLWPANLCFNYPRWHVNPNAWRQWLYPAAALAVLLILWLTRRRIGRGPLAAALFFVGTLFPSLGFMNAYFMTYSFVCDHWTYLSSLGLIALAAALITRLAAHAPRAANLYIFAPALLLTLTLLTARQSAIFSDPETLWRDTLTKNPDAWLAHNNLGVLLGIQGKPGEALAHYQEALRLDPTFPQAHNNLGLILMDNQQIPQAIEQFDLAIQFAPNFPQAHLNLGIALQDAGRYNDAIAQYQLALTLNPYFYHAHYSLGTVLDRVGRSQQAVQEFNEALKIQPNSAEAHNMLAVALLRLGQFDQAIAQWQQTLRIQPDFPGANYNCGLALEKLGRINDAITQYQEALDLARSTGQSQLATQIQTRLQLLRTGRSYGTPSDTTGPPKP